MTRKRRTILGGMAAGAVWALVVVWGGMAFPDLPPGELVRNLALAFLGPGLVTLLLIARLAQRRFFDDSIVDGEPYAVGSAAEIDHRVLGNTIEQAVLALLLWPAVAILLRGDGPGVAIALGANFTFARLFFWVGYHLSPPLRAFGFAATFYPTIAALVWAIVSVGRPVG